MHNLLRKSLENAIGESQYVIAVILDIRNFSTFSKSCESPDVAMFIKKVYIKFIDEYFNYASFFKPTGDGLLLTFLYTERNLREVIQKVFKSCITVLSSFGSFCTTDPMINFDVPTELGIGITRGTACRIFSRNKTLDYSGRVLNLASRLMDFARPSGIVFDSDFDVNLLSENQAKLFVKDKIYIKGVAETGPMDIFYTKDLTNIPKMARWPIKEMKWGKVEDAKKLAEIKKIRGRFRYVLPTKPINPDDVSVQIKSPVSRNGKLMKGLYTYINFKNFIIQEEAGDTLVIIDFEALEKRLEAKSVKKSWAIEITINYPER